MQISHGAGEEPALTFEAFPLSPVGAQLLGKDDMPAVQSREYGRSGALVPGGRIVPEGVREGTITQARYGQVRRGGAERAGAGGKPGDVHDGRFARTNGGCAGSAATNLERIGLTPRRVRGSGQPPWPTCGWVQARTCGVF